VTFSDSGTNNGTSRTIQFVVNDGDTDSNMAAKTVDIGPPNN
jgi:hypothetical protein